MKLVEFQREVLEHAESGRKPRFCLMPRSEWVELACEAAGLHTHVGGPNWPDGRWYKTATGAALAECTLLYGVEIILHDEREVEFASSRECGYCGRERLRHEEACAGCGSMEMKYRRCRRAR